MAIRGTLNSSGGSFSFRETSANGVSYFVINVFKLRGLL